MKFPFIVLYSFLEKILVKNRLVPFMDKASSRSRNHVSLTEMNHKHKCIKVFNVLVLDI